jgi:hypothetical protein
MVLLQSLLVRLASGLVDAAGEWKRMCRQCQYRRRISTADAWQLSSNFMGSQTFDEAPKEQAQPACGALYTMAWRLQNFVQTIRSPEAL